MSEAKAAASSSASESESLASTSTSLELADDGLRSRLEDDEIDLLCVWVERRNGKGGIGPPSQIRRISLLQLVLRETACESRQGTPFTTTDSPSKTSSSVMIPKGITAGSKLCRNYVQLLVRQK